MMFKANSMFGVAPDFLKPLWKAPDLRTDTTDRVDKILPTIHIEFNGLFCVSPEADETPGNTTPKLHECLNRQHDTDDRQVSDVPANEITQNKTVSNNWDEYLRQVGEEFRIVRTSLGISLNELHHKTRVPIAHIEALETGQIEALPTAVYVRGFISKIGNALGLDGDRLAESLPQQDSLKTVLPSLQFLPSSRNTISFRLPLLCMSYCSLLIVSIFWLHLQEQVALTKLKKPEISEIKVNKNTENAISIKP